MKIKGLGQVKLCRIAAAFEIARRIVNQILVEKQT
jgi:DNA repair protein RadC